MDYREVVRTLRAKADSTEFPEEAKALREKADELEKKYHRVKEPTVTKVTITFVHDGRWTTKTLDFPDDWYDSMDEWGDTSDWYSGAEP